MSIRSLLWGMTIAGTLTGAAFLLVLFYFDPQITDGIGVGLFFVSFITSLLIWLTLGLFQYRMKSVARRLRALESEEAQGELFINCLRYAGLITFVVGSILLFQVFRVTTWWNILLVLAVPVVVESYARIKVE